MRKKESKNSKHRFLRLSSGPSYIPQIFMCLIQLREKLEDVMYISSLRSMYMVGFAVVV